MADLVQGAATVRAEPGDPQRLPRQRFRPGGRGVHRVPAARSSRAQRRSHG
ncbi:hypothetical protein [Streptomyces sp. NPDC004050]